MKGNDKVIEQLNTRLAEELAAINQYMVHSEMCENWKYGKLHGAIEKRAIQEMKHAEKLISRILFLEGRPVVTNLGKLAIGGDVQKMHEFDLGSELNGLKGYSESIRLATDTADYGTKELLESILKEEEEHVDWLEAHLDQIRQMGIQIYLAEQMD